MLESRNLYECIIKYKNYLEAEIGDVNIIVGEEVSGTVTAKLQDVAWDSAFQTLLDMKTLVADIDAANGIIRIHTPTKLTEQEAAKSARAEVLKKKIELEESVEPILAEIFRLYYISPEQAKKTLEGDMPKTAPACENCNYLKKRWEVSQKNPKDLL